jgi:hypothetical protein
MLSTRGQSNVNYLIYNISYNYDDSFISSTDNVQEILLQPFTDNGATTPNENNHNNFYQASIYLNYSNLIGPI